MALQIKDKIVLKQIDYLSALRGVPKVDVLRAALQHEMERETSKPRLKDLIAPLQAKLAAIATRTTRLTVEEEKQASDELWGRQTGSPDRRQGF